MAKLLLTVILVLSAALASAQESKVVYHITTGIDTAASALTNIQNHLDAEPRTQIVVVTNGPGIDFLMADAKDSSGREFSGMVSDLAGNGVEFRVCQNTLTSRKLDPEKLLLETSLVPSGVAEATRLQIKEGFAYLKP